MARGTVDVVPVVLSTGLLRDAILKRYPSLKAGCRDLGISYRLVFNDGPKRGIRRDTLAYLAGRLDSPQLHALAESGMGWSRPRGFTLGGEEPTYDFEVPGARSFIANGIAVHNSHAACYAMVAYQTAYFKANYPVEFMAALLTSEMDKTDKIVQYMEESRAMGLRVEPPDVNVCRTRFTVSGDAIHFGLGAIKNVGGAAIDSVVRARQEGGPFGSLPDFCARADLRLVNRRVIESLIKAGAFDSVKIARAALLASLDQAMEAGQRRQRDREEGQVSLFEGLAELAPAGGKGAGRAPSVTVPEWPHDELLGYEKEVLGFYLSGHPLEQYREVGRRLGAATAGELYARAVGARVLLLGQISAFTENSTKSGNRMAFATLDLVDGTAPLTIFPEPYRSCAGALRQRGPLVVRGRIDDSDKGRVVLAEEIRPLEEALAGAGEPGRSALTCRIRVRVGDRGMGALLTSVRTICQEHRGRTPLFLHVLLPEQEVVIRVRELSVEPDPALATKLETLLGEGSILVEYAGRA